jgi:hypothetical protein
MSPQFHRVTLRSRTIESQATKSRLIFLWHCMLPWPLMTSRFRQRCMVRLCLPRVSASKGSPLP